ncbi:uncharacterized protein A1O9_12106 [Exophiala aquamarina CBS 119918]|uniref:Uncharacterized protein n=1 Tax=Exophiala aquamarina CBS 119918 TaxID=1182545 RepID=A0A072NV94_9EURO|nr:uncharacterized protein A1O9_12106 [Exophiala aquamarina CBS 119918]KEF51769.1 hypothetical protein A1O9_12106 [Exophiala aquamarina CBS 119918]
MTRYQWTKWLPNLRVQSPTNREKKLLRTHEERQEKLIPDRSALWLPLSLTRVSLLVFVIVLISLLIALGVLKYRADQDRGLTIITSNHYTWTYGPTAILVLVTAYWRLVDYNCKALTPWAELAKGPANADRSLLLDYVSPFLGLTVVTSARRGHFSVSSTGLGFLLSKLVTIASTGLFFPAEVPSDPVQVQLSQATRFNNITNFTGFHDPGVWPFYTAYAILEKGYPLSEGADNAHVYETFRPMNDTSASNAAYQVEASALVPHVACDPVEVDRILDDSGTTMVWRLQVRNGSGWVCPVSGATNDGISIVSLNIRDKYCPPRQLWPSFAELRCTRDTPQSGSEGYPLFVGLSDLRYTQNYNFSLDGHIYGDLITPETYDLEVLKTTAMLCTVSHTEQLTRLTYNMSSIQNPVQSAELLPTTANISLQNVPIDYLSSALNFASQSAGSTSAGNLFGPTDPYTAFTEQPINTLLTMVAEYAASNYAFMLDHPTDMAGAVQDVLHQMTIQVMKSTLVSPTNETFRGAEVAGQKIQLGSRLQVQKLSMITMIVGVFCMAISIILVMFFRPMTTHTINPTTLAAAAHALQNSPNVQAQLSGMVFSPPQHSHSEIRKSQWLGQGSLPTMVLHSISSAEESRELKEISLTTPIRYYRPFTLRKPFLWSTFLVPLLLIGILEYLQHLSDNRSDLGIVSLSANSITQSLVARYIPAVVALLVATMFNCLDANTAILSPFSTMVDREVSNDDLSHTWLDRTPPMMIYQAIRRHQWGYSLTTLASVVGSALTIVISGLYTVENIPRSDSVSLITQDSWNMSFHQGLSTDNGTALVSSLIESANLSYPAFTFDELVFPNMALNSSNNALKRGGSGLVGAKVPALRAELDCTDIPFNLMNYSFSWNSHYGFSQISFSGHIPLPDNCQLGSAYGNESFVSMSMAGGGWWSKDDSNVSYVGQVLDLHVGAWPGEDNHIIYEETGDSAAPNQPDNPPGCPSVLIFYGFLDGTNSTNNVWRSMLCDQKVQKLITDITLSLPELKISTEHPPVVDESTMEYLSSGPNGETSFWWRTEPGISSSFRILNNSVVDPLLLEYDDVVPSSTVVSSFFRGAMYGMTPFPLETLQQDDEKTKDRIFDHLHMFYRRYMAQYISANMRTTEDPSENTSRKRDGGTVNTPTVDGAYMPDTGTPRLMQARTPKIVLQAMLAFMIVCAGLALCVGTYHDLVPWNPCTIAGLLILFVGSRMCAPRLSSLDCPNQLIPKKDIYTFDSPTKNVGGQNATTYELSYFPDQGPLRPRYQDSTNSIQPSLQNVRSTQTDISMTTSMDWKDPRARFRLGWWNKGRFVGSRRPARQGRGRLRGGQYDRIITREDSQDYNWRYGIDML